MYPNPVKVNEGTPTDFTRVGLGHCAFKLHCHL